VALGDYLLSVAGLLAVVGPLAFAAVRLRGRLLGWEGPPARLAEAVLTASLLTVTLQLLAAFGILNPATLIIASLAVGAATLMLVPRRPGVGPPATVRTVPRIHFLLALAGAGFLAVHWATGLQDVWGGGIDTFDSLWYHGPFSARIADAGDVWPLHFTDPLYLNWFYPENSELQHSAGMVLFGNDVLSPLLNFGWLGLALLAAWCIGRPFGMGALSLLAVVIVLDTGPMVPREAGTMANDIAPIALLLSAAAILITAESFSRATESGRPGAPLLVAGLAAGLALGTKMTIAGAVAALAVGLVVAAGPGLRRRAAVLFVGGVALTAGFWFLRNLIHTGNPLPWIHELGPIELPGPGRGLEGRDPFSVSHYIFENPSGDVWRSFFFEGVKNLLGPGWFLILGGASAGALSSLLRPRTPIVRVLGAVAVVAAIAYLFTPLTAAGPDGQPTAFTINFRYALGAISLGLALLALWEPLAADRFRLPGGGELRGEPVRTALLIGGLLVLAITASGSDSAQIWDDPYTRVPAAILIGLVLVAAPVGLALLGSRSPGAAAVSAGALVLAVVAIGYERQDDYLEGRYADGEGFQYQLDDAVAWANPLEGERIAVAGTSGAYNQYGFYGTELENYVQFVGREGSGGDFEAIGKCRPWRRTLNAGDYDYLVTTPGLDLNHPEDVSPTPERGWVQGDPNAAQLLRSGRVSVFALSGPLDPGGCAR
jgi:hypothetical protein